MRAGGEVLEVICRVCRVSSGPSQLAKLNLVGNPYGFVHFVLNFEPLSFTKHTVQPSNSP